MTSRERVLTAIEYRRPDRVPRDFWIEQPAMRRLQAHLGLDDEEAVRQRLRVDVRHLHAVYPEDMPITQAAGGAETACGLTCAPGPAVVFQNYWGERFIFQETPWGPMREDLPGALSEAEALDELAAFPWPTPDL
ncbi:MAG: hypothetical protein KKI08_09285, partial [Armatimonadetes bacterium]|nr:hypothetical protein [Armatimonadota bacterium]